MKWACIVLMIDTHPDPDTNYQDVTGNGSFDRAAHRGLNIVRDGQLTDGSEYRVRTIFLANLDITLFVLSHECAQVLGYGAG